MKLAVMFFMLMSILLNSKAQAKTTVSEKNETKNQTKNTNQLQKPETDWLAKMRQLEKEATQSFFQEFSKLKIKKINDPSLQKVGEVISSYENLLIQYHKNKKNNPNFDASQILLKRIVKWTLDSIAMGTPYETLDSFYDLLWSEADFDYPKLIREMVTKNHDLSKTNLKFLYQRMDEQQKNRQ